MNWDADFAAYHLIVWGGSVAGLTGCEGQNRIDVRVFEIGIFPENRLSRWPADIKPRMSATVMRKPRIDGLPCMRLASIVILFNSSDIGNTMR